MVATSLEQQARRLAALAEPVRRDLYLFVAGADEPVSRDAAARAVGVGRSLAAHHLDRLADDGLLAVEYRRLTGRTGPGAGRPAKLYRRADTQVSVTLPERRYELAGLLLAEAVEEAARGGDPVAALHARAHDCGRARAGEAAAAPAQGGGAAPGDTVVDPTGAGGDETGARALTALAADGYEPGVTDEGVDLRNCPFHALVEEHRTLVCGMNLALLRGFVEGLGPEAAPWSPVLDPREGRCCVRLVPREG